VLADTQKNAFPDTKFYFMAREPLRILCSKTILVSPVLSLSPPHAEDFSWKDVAMISMSLRQVRPTSDYPPPSTSAPVIWQPGNSALGCVLVTRVSAGRGRSTRTRPDKSRAGIKT
jgi:hypothetical protein